VETDLLPAYITHADCSRHEMGPHHPECPERLGAINDMLLVKGLLDYMHPYYAPLATPEQLAHAHSSLYVAELIDSSPAEGYHRVDPDTEMNPFTVQAALRAAGAVVWRGAQRVLLRAPTGAPRRTRRCHGVLLFQQHRRGHTPRPD
jgi:acetoin utilization deacetylase AcuC-like enzyme